MHVLEAITAGVIIFGTIVFAIQSTAITPLTGSTSNQHIENQHQKMADGALQSANTVIVDEQNGTTAVEHAVLNWNETTDTFNNATASAYTQAPPNQFGDILRQTFRNRQVATNINLAYTIDQGNITVTQPMITQGRPSGNAVTATTTITLLDDDKLTAPGTGANVTASTSYLIPDASPQTQLYNVVTVKLIVWRI